MLIGSQYSDNKMYRGIKHFDKMPLTSEDIHEYSDTSYMKNAYIMNNLLGYGTLNTPNIIISPEGLSLSEPSVVMIDGDIALVQSDKNVPFISKDEIEELYSTEGIVCILGWYQYISAGSTMRNYGGVNNSILENDLLNEKFNLQISARYQFRWLPVVVDKSNFLSDEVHIYVRSRDIDGNIIEGQRHGFRTIEKKGNVHVFSSVTIDYAESDLYLIPIAEYNYDISSDTVTSARSLDKLRAGYPFIVSELEPTGILPDGTTWYNPITREFKTYVEESGGFVASASKMAFLQYQSVYTIDENIETPQDIVVPVNISELAENDILQVVYEGAVLVLGEHFNINYEDNTITLLDFTTTIDDHIYFTATKIVEANDITNITETFVKHMNTTSSSTVEGHVKLSDNVSDIDASQGIAATPKAIHDVREEVKRNMANTTTQLQKEISDSKLLIDSTTNLSYRLGIENGLLYIEEV